jgi:(1->4)-alpha-D-glucan 1-alpha-D-glucosylmutase
MRAHGVTDGVLTDDEVALPAGSWHDLLTDRPVTSGRLADLLADFPVALLVRAQGV